MSSSLYNKNDFEKLYSCFLHLDHDGKGFITTDELLNLPGIKNNSLATRIVALFDSDGDGRVSFEEFVNYLAKFSCKGKSEDKLKLAFDIYDIDNDGFISPGELFIVLKQMSASHLSDQQLQQVVDKTIRDADYDCDNKICFDEFCKIITERNHLFVEQWSLGIF
jgi:serine/threonine-protein phosphatase 2B regulatory subunit